MEVFGELVAIIVAFSWAFSAIFFEYAGKRIGSLQVNLYRLLFAFVFLGILLYFLTGSMLPKNADFNTWFWMALSGISGFVIGDLCLFYAYVSITSRFAQLIMTLSPPMAALSGWLILDEKMSPMGYLGMAVTLFGVAISILKREGESGHKKLKLELPIKGVIMALFGAIGQGVGLVLSKKGMIYYEQSANTIVDDKIGTIPFAATQMRVITGIIGFVLIIILSKKVKVFFDSLKDKKGISLTFCGALFGPFIGVSMSLLAVRIANVGVASTIMATTPIILLLLHIIIKKKRVSLVEVAGAIISVAGVSLFFL